MQIVKNLMASVFRFIIKTLHLKRPDNPKALHVNMDTLKIEFKPKRKASGTFTIHYFRDHDQFVAYSPSFNLSAYGENADEAIDRLLTTVFDDFFDHLTLLGSDRAVRELVKLGWEKENVFFKKRFISKSYVDREGVLKNFNLPKETEVDTRIVTV